MSVYMKLWKLQQKVKGLKTDAEGGGYNNKYKYVTGNKILGEVKPIMNELGLLLKQEILDVKNERIDYHIKNGEKSEMLYNVKMRFTWIDCETGTKDEVLFHAAGANGWDKGLGSALTYGERYFLLKQLHIATDEDDIDNIANMKEDAIKEYDTPQKSTAKPSNNSNPNEDKGGPVVQSREEEIIEAAKKKKWPIGKNKGQSVLWVYENSQSDVKFLWEKARIPAEDIKAILKDLDSIGYGQETGTPQQMPEQKTISDILKLAIDPPRDQKLQGIMAKNNINALADLDLEKLEWIKGKLEETPSKYTGNQLNN